MAGKTTAFSEGKKKPSSRVSLRWGEPLEEGPLYKIRQNVQFALASR